MFKQHATEWRMAPRPVDRGDDPRHKISHRTMDVHDSPQDNLTAFIDELRRYSRSQKAMWTYMRTFNACIYPVVVGTNVPYWSRYSNGLMISHRYFTVFREEFCIMLNQTRQMNDELEHLHQEFTDMCQHGNLSASLAREDDCTLGYVLEHLLRRALEGEFRMIDGEADKLQTGLRNCQLLFSAFWVIVSECGGENCLFPSDDLARSGWKFRVVEAEDPEHPARNYRYSSEEALWNYHMSALPQSLLESIANNRGLGWWMQDPSLKEDLVRQSEVSWDIESIYGDGTGLSSGNASDDEVNGEAIIEWGKNDNHRYMSWGLRRFRRAVLEHDRVLKTTGRALIKDPVDLIHRRYEVFCAGPGAHLDSDDAIIANKVRETDRPAECSTVSVTDPEPGIPHETKTPGRESSAQEKIHHPGQMRLADPTNGVQLPGRPVSGNYGDLFGGLERLERLLRITGRAGIE